MPRKRKTFWITGLDFFEIRQNYDPKIIDELMEAFKVDFLPIQLKEYLLKLESIDTTDPAFYCPDVKIQDCRIELDKTMLINPDYDVFWCPFYNHREIFLKIKESDGIYIGKKVMPICESVPCGDVVISLNNDDTFGKLYYVTDIYEFSVSEAFLFANCLFDFITALRQVPFRLTDDNS
jgi:hypothetical protein